MDATDLTFVETSALIEELKRRHRATVIGLVADDEKLGGVTLSFSGSPLMCMGMIQSLNLSLTQDVLLMLKSK